MSALQDILATEATPNAGFFSTVFANSFFSNQASINALQTKTITLTGENGIIKSEDYIQNTSGWRIQNKNNETEIVDVDFNGNTHIGGELTVDGEATFGANCLFNGNINSSVIEDLDKLNILLWDEYYKVEVGKSWEEVNNHYLAMGFEYQTESSTKWYNETVLYDNFYYKYYRIEQAEDLSSFGELSIIFSTDGKTRNKRIYIYIVNFIADPNRPLGWQNLESNFIYKPQNENTREFKLKKLPNYNPKITNCIYYDNEGYLRISI